MQPQDPDSLYQGYDKNLYRITGDEESDSIMEMLSSDPTQNNSGNVQVSSSDIGSGVNTATSPQATGSIQAGKQTFTDTTDGYFLGIVNGLGVFSLGGASSYVKWDGSTLSVVGGVSISQLDIPNTTSANSFHTDTNGNSWWGTNLATGYATAPAYILNTGAAIFQNVAIGGTTIQYVITNSGIFSFGDGSDGNAIADGSTAVAGMSLSGGNYTLTRDVYFNDLTINVGVTVFPSGYRIFVKDTLTLNGTIDRSGAAGTNGGAGGNALGGGVGGLPGTAGTGAGLSDGYLKGSPNPGSSGAGGHGYDINDLNGTLGGNASSGTAVTNSLGSASVGSGTAGTGANTGTAGGSTASTATATVSNVKLIANWHLSTLLDIIQIDNTPSGYKAGQTIKFTSSASAPGAPGGGGGGSTIAGAGNREGGGGGGGGGTGAPGGILAIYARNILIGATGVISANGGKGGNGGNGGNGDATTTSGNAGGGGGGGAGAPGGNGGDVVMVYNSLTNNGSITATGGLKGTKGTGGTSIQVGGSLPNGGNGTDGNNGSDGTIYQFQLSL